ncbi:MAG TPA: YggT family protein [Gemmatimonadales bacterium]|nr:YggT family protein [Gemmatimonadales bacterium]
MFAVYTVARMVVFAAFAGALVVAVAAWAVRTRRVSPFSALGRAFRSLSDPVVSPVERALVRVGGSPRHAGWWLVVGVAAAGVLLLTLLEWVARTVAELEGAAGAGPTALARLGVELAYDVLVIALFVRVVGSWLGTFRYARGMRLVYGLTDWLVEPLRRVLPPFGAFDWSPLAAWLVLWVLRALLVAII